MREWRGVNDFGFTSLHGCEREREIERVFCIWNIMFSEKVEGFKRFWVYIPPWMIHQVLVDRGWSLFCHQPLSAPVLDIYAREWRGVNDCTKLFTSLHECK